MDYTRTCIAFGKNKERNTGSRKQSTGANVGTNKARVVSALGRAYTPPVFEEESEV